MNLAYAYHKFTSRILDGLELTHTQTWKNNKQTLCPSSHFCTQT